MITQVANPSSVPSAVADYEAQNAHITAFNLLQNNQPFILTNSGGTGLPAIKLGSYIQFGGNLYVVDTSDYAITGTPVNGNNYIRISGTTTLTAEWVQNISSYVWNEVYGYKYTGSYAILPYLVVKDGTSYEKYSLMQQNKRITGDLSVSGNVGSATSTISGNATVGGTLGVSGALSAPTLNTGQGANELYAMNQNVRTTDSPTFNALTVSSLDTGQGANELYAMNQNVRTTDSPTFADATVASKLLSTYLAYLNQGVKTTDSPTFNALTVSSLNTGQGANELYAMNQNVRTTDSPTFASINTGQGANELYAMDQNVRTTDSPAFANATIAGHDVDTQLDNSVSHIANTSNPHSVTASQLSLGTTDAVTFASVNTGQGANELYAMNQNVRTTDSVEFAHISPNSCTIVDIIVNANSTLLVPKGIYMLTLSSVSGSESIYIETKKLDGSWYTHQLLEKKLTALISDGVSVRFKNDNSSYNGLIGAWKF